MLTLSLPVVSGSLEKNIKRCLQAEALSSLCECGHSQKKKLDLWTLPPVLVFHLKKFQFSREQVVKKTASVEAPVVLDMKQFTRKPSIAEYHLFAVVEHVGSPANGHYTATCWNKYTSQWHRFDDEDVVVVPDSVANSPNAYLLFYCNASLVEIHKQDVNDPGTWPFVLSRALSLTTEN